MGGGDLKLLKSEERERLELVLLRNLRDHAMAFGKLLEEISRHWSYEDGVYRFYHQSFKVFYLQEDTARIVAALRSAAPEGRDFCEMFRQLLDAGTGREFKTEDNERWVERTAPIVQAFLHAKYFLDMAVKYAGQFESAPQAMPSDYAALLCFYDIR